MNFFKIIDISKSGGAKLKRLTLLLMSSTLFNISEILNRVETLNLSKSRRQLFIKFFSGRLNIRFYNKLSKETGDFKDSRDKHIYIQH